MQAIWNCVGLADPADSGGLAGSAADVSAGRARAAPAAAAVAMRKKDRRGISRVDIDDGSLMFHQTNGVTPGTATGGSGSGPHSYFGGDRSSFEFSACSQVMTCPV